LVDALMQAEPDPGDVVYVQRSGEQYGWRITDSDGGLLATPSEGEPSPDAWIYFSGAWPPPERKPAFVEDLLAEMESMVDAGDRCRWPLDEPWPHVH
jgi:hypothetical protein